MFVLSLTMLQMVIGLKIFFLWNMFCVSTMLQCKYYMHAPVHVYQRSKQALSHNFKYLRGQVSKI